MQRPRSHSFPTAIPHKCNSPLSPQVRFGYLTHAHTYEGHGSTGALLLTGSGSAQSNAIELYSARDSESAGPTVNSQSVGPTAVDKLFVVEARLA